MVPPVSMLLLTLSACAGAGSTPAPSDGSSDIPGATRPPVRTLPPTREGGSVLPTTPEAIPDTAWAAILEDLARRNGAPIADPVVVEATAVTWKDGSLGCPVPGQMYTQALVDGYQVILEVDGEQFDYRVGSGANVRLCGSPLEGG